PRRSAPSRSCARANGTICPSRHSCGSAASRKRPSRPRRSRRKESDMILGLVHVVVVTPEQAVLDEKVDFVALPMSDGELGVRPGRARLIGRLGFGELRTRRGKQEQRYYIDGGFVQIRANEVTVLTPKAVPEAELKVSAASKALEAALVPGKSPADQEAQLKAQGRARAQLRLARKHGGGSLN